MRIGEDVFYESVATIRLRVRQAVEEAIALRVFDCVMQVAIFLVAECFTIAHQKLKVAGVRLVDARIVNLIDDAMTEREPETATRVVRRAHAFLRA